MSSSNKWFQRSKFFFYEGCSYIINHVKGFFTWLFCMKKASPTSSVDIQSSSIQTSDASVFRPDFHINLGKNGYLQGPYIKLGEGAMGTVWKFKLKEEYVAVKISTVNDHNDDSQRHEIGLLKKASSHPNIVKYILDVTYCNKMLIVFELMHGSVHDLLEKIKLSWPTKLSLAKQLLAGLSHLHNLNSGKSEIEAIVHQDLNTDNLLVSELPNSPYIKLKISDFGIARRIDQYKIPIIHCKITTSVHQGYLGGTRLYMAPEVISNPAVCDPKSDVFSTGVILFELAKNKRPIRNKIEVTNGSFSEFENDKLSSPKFVSKYKALGVSTGTKAIPTYPISSFFGPIINKCIKRLPGERHSAAKVLRQLQSITLNEL